MRHGRARPLLIALGRPAVLWQSLMVSRKSNKEDGRSGARALKVRVRTAKKRRLSSTLWLERQLNDPYVAAAKREGYRSRAAYKLREIAEKYEFLRPGDIVIDLGAAPGGWSQVAATRVQSVEGRGAVVAIDLSEMAPIPGVTILHADFMADDAPRRIIEALGGRKADAVLSDMAAPATGHARTDHLRIMGLCEAALAFAVDVLAPDGVFLCKVLQGGTERDLLETMKRAFAVVRHIKPKASRADSAELYVLATGFRGSG
jgi:23S rRNA (uridine2552-2'-O)-methyltransferase